MVLETERLILRPITMEDAADIFEYSGGPNVGPAAGWKPHESMEETKEIIKTVFLNQENVFGVVLRESGKLIGSAGLIADPKRENAKTKMLGYAIGEKYWGCGYMTEAAEKLVEYGFKQLGLLLISAYRFSHNLRSGRVMEKCGFTYEGTLKLAEELYDGSVQNHVCYAITRGEYFA